MKKKQKSIRICGTCPLSAEEKGGKGYLQGLKVYKIENFFGFDLEICTISLLVMSKY